MRLYFFGIGPNDTAGHYLHDVDGRKVWDSREYEIPFRYTILDGGLIPQKEAGFHGKVFHSTINGWTVISMPDFSSADKRPGCSASFIAEGIFTKEEMSEIVKKNFSVLWN